MRKHKFNAALFNWRVQKNWIVVTLALLNEYHRLNLKTCLPGHIHVHDSFIATWFGIGDEVTAGFLVSVRPCYCGSPDAEFCIDDFGSRFWY